MSHFNWHMFEAIKPRKISARDTVVQQDEDGCLIYKQYAVKLKHTRNSSSNCSPHWWKVWINQYIFNRQSISCNATHRQSYDLIQISSQTILCGDYSYLNTDMCTFESSQKDESEAHSVDSSKSYSKTGVNSSSSSLTLWQFKLFPCFSLSHRFDCLCQSRLSFQGRGVRWQCIFLFSRHR